MPPRTKPVIEEPDVIDAPDRRLDLDYCGECGTAFAPGLPACPHCGENKTLERN